MKVESKEDRIEKMWRREKKKKVGEAKIGAETWQG
jgi:hypothetical protein